MIAAAGGLLAVVAYVLGGTLLSYAACTTLCPDKDDACPPSCWPEPDAGDTSGPEPSIAVPARRFCTVEMGGSLAGIVASGLTPKPLGNPGPASRHGDKSSSSGG
jgi:hypothetical protein